MAISRRSEGVAVGQERVGHEKIGSGCTTSPNRSEPQEKGWSCGHIHVRGQLFFPVNNTSNLRNQISKLPLKGLPSCP